MRTDPNQACDNSGENRLWALVHDGTAHPLMAITNYSALSVRFHDFTSRKAWPKVWEGRTLVELPTWDARIEPLRSLLRQQGVAHMTEGRDGKVVIKLLAPRARS